MQHSIPIDDGPLHPDDTWHGDDGWSEPDADTDADTDTDTGRHRPHLCGLIVPDAP